MQMFQCDECGFIGNTFGDYDPLAWDKLKRWITIRRDGVLSPSPHLCGLNCLKAWTEKQIQHGAR